MGAVRKNGFTPVYDNRPSREVVEGRSYVPHIRRIGEEKLEEAGEKRYPALGSGPQHDGYLSGEPVLRRPLELPGERPRSNLPSAVSSRQGSTRLTPGIRSKSRSNVTISSSFRCSISAAW